MQRETDLDRLIKGHPTVPLIRGNGLPDKALIVCSECGEVKDLIILQEDADRYRCLKCGGSGPVQRRRKQFGIHIPALRRR